MGTIMVPKRHIKEILQPSCLEVNVKVQGTKLKVAAERKRDDNVVVSQYLQEFELDNKAADTKHVQATLKDGVLTIMVPKRHIKEIPQPSCFEVKVESTDALVKDDSIRLTFDLPGVKVADMKVSIDVGSLFWMP